jgi:glucose/arabinose dehydrogenase
VEKCEVAMRRWTVSVLGGVVVGACSICLGDPPFPLANDPRIDPSKFRVTTFASGLAFPTAMQKLSDGSLLVAINDPTGGRFYASTGKLLRLTDANGDGVADDAGTYLNTNLPGAISQMRQAGSLIVANSALTAGSSLSILRAGATPSSPITSLGTINFGFPSNQTHKSYGLAVRPVPATTNSYEVFFNVGSRFNSSNDTALVPLTGLLSGNVSGESICRFVLTDNGASVALSNLQVIATGLRNAAGMAFAPGSGNLYLQDNGIDGLVDPDEPLSVDEVNVIPSAQIGVSPPNFGFAGDYIEYRTGNRIGSGGVQPVGTFQPIAGSESEGAAEIAMAPANFPAGLNNGFFVGFHGKFSLAGVANEENPVLYFDTSTNTSFQFLSNDLPNIGHIDNILATNDALFLADITSAGSIFTTTAAGAIYQVQAVPEPATAAVIIFGAAGIACRSGRRRVVS